MPRAAKEKDQIDQLIDQLDLNGITQEEMFGEGGLIKTLTSRLLNKALEAEMDHHLGYRKNSVAGTNSGNSRNGHTKKKVLTNDQEVEIEVPRDRNGEFEPAIVPKYSMLESTENVRTLHPLFFVPFQLTLTEALIPPSRIMPCAYPRKGRRPSCR